MKCIKNVFNERSKNRTKKRLKILQHRLVLATSRAWTKKETRIRHTTNTHQQPQQWLRPFRWARSDFEGTMQCMAWIDCCRYDEARMKWFVRRKCFTNHGPNRHNSLLTNSICGQQRSRKMISLFETFSGILRRVLMMSAISNAKCNDQSIQMH